MAMRTKDTINAIDNAITALVKELGKKRYGAEIVLFAQSFSVMALTRHAICARSNSTYNPFREEKTK